MDDDNIVACVEMECLGRIFDVPNWIWWMNFSLCYKMYGMNVWTKIKWREQTGERAIRRSLWRSCCVELSILLRGRENGTRANWEKEFYRSIISSTRIHLCSVYTRKKNINIRNSMVPMGSWRTVRVLEELRTDGKICVKQQHPFHKATNTGAENTHTFAELLRHGKRASVSRMTHTHGQKRANWKMRRWKWSW